MDKVTGRIEFLKILWNKKEGIRQNTFVFKVFKNDKDYTKEFLIYQNSKDKMSSNKLLNGFIEFIDTNKTIDNLKEFFKILNKSNIYCFNVYTDFIEFNKIS